MASDRSGAAMSATGDTAQLVQPPPGSGGPGLAGGTPAPRAGPVPDAAGELSQAQQLRRRRQFPEAKKVLECARCAHPDDNEFVIGLVGAELHPLSHLVQSMRKTRQTSEFIAQMGPFFVGHVLARNPG